MTLGSPEAKNIECRLEYLSARMPDNRAPNRAPSSRAAAATNTDLQGVFAVEQARTYSSIPFPKVLLATELGSLS